MHRISGNGTPPPEGHTDPDYAPTVEVFDNLTHADIQRGVLELRPEVLTQGRQAWQGSAAGVAEAVQSAHAEIRGAIADGWRGGAAQLAADAVTAFERLGQQLSDVMAVVGQRLGQANDAAETLRATVSQQSAVTPNLEAALLDPKQATMNAALQKSTENLRQDAVRVMETVYAGVFLRTGDSVPAFSEGSMYPDPRVAPPEPTAPGGGSADLVGDATTPKVLPTTDVRPDAEPADGRDDSGRPGTDAPVAVTPAAAPAPAAAVPVVPSPVPTATATAAVAPVAAVPGESAMPVSNPVVPQPNAPSASALAEPSAAVPTAAAGRVTPAAATGTAPASNSPNSEHDKRDDHDQDHGPSGDAVSGMGAGVMGGLAGGAFAAGDAVRQGPSGPVAVKPPHHEDDEYEDEDYYAEFEEEPTFLEPAEPGGELVGRMEPTTPPVLGEWSEND
ncbi:hypothetical protein AB0L57_19180 [Nocardia sp. NPDC052254]|uniref:WXG100 family type VII secretion target n=1 Tax=Nocardia sp. NPDC052254 TaxID=3155681 RepID=UPI00341C82B4